jgi:hypothetical protein
MTAKEEDILTSSNLIKKGVAIDKLLQSLIVTEGVNLDDLLLGDKNAIMVAARVLAYGPDYTCTLNDDNLDEEERTQTFNLANCPFKKLPDNIKENNIPFQLPISKQKITFKLLTTKEEKIIDQEIKASQKVGVGVSPELTTRFRHVITSVDGDSSQEKINALSQGMLARDSLALRGEIVKVTPDIIMKQSIEIGGNVVEVDIPLTTEFFWPST